MKYFLILFLLVISLYAKDFSTRYNVHVSIFGDVGYADVELKEFGDEYEIKLVANTTGVAATLLKHRVETYISKGKIVKGRYIPDTFIKIKATTKRVRRQTYHFDHEKKEIELIEEKTKFVKKLKFKPSSFELISEDVKKSSKKKSVVDEYKEGDVLSFYLNTHKLCSGIEKFYKLKALGAHDEKNNITVSLLNESDKQAVKSNFLGEPENIYNLHVEPFDKDDNIVDVLIVFDNDGLLKEALMDEIFWVGKITAKRVQHKITRN